MSMGEQGSILTLAKLEAHNKHYEEDAFSYRSTSFLPGTRQPSERMQTAVTIGHSGWEPGRPRNLRAFKPLGKMPSATPSEQEILFQQVSPPSLSPFTRSLEKARSMEKGQPDVTRRQFQAMARQLQKLQMTKE